MQKMVDKWSIKPTLAQKLADILEFVADKEVFTTEDVVRHFSFTPTGIQTATNEKASENGIVSD